MSDRAKTSEILEALKAMSDDKIWATELALLSGSRRIDFWTLAPVASQGFRASAYEIKVSMADFRRDTEEKQAEAVRYSDRFWYVTPAGLLARSMVPDWAGLMELDGKVFNIKKRAPRLTRKAPDWEFVVSLMRNCGESRRDISLIKMENNHLKWRCEQLERQEIRRRDAQLAKWVRCNATGRAMGEKDTK